MKLRFLSVIFTCLSRDLWHFIYVVPHAEFVKQDLCYRAWLFLALAL